MQPFLGPRLLQPSEVEPKAEGGAQHLEASVLSGDPLSHRQRFSAQWGRGGLADHAKGGERKSAGAERKAAGVERKAAGDERKQ